MYSFLHAKEKNPLSIFYAPGTVLDPESYMHVVRIQDLWDKQFHLCVPSTGRQCPSNVCQKEGEGLCSGEPTQRSSELILGAKEYPPVFSTNKLYP